MAEKVYKLRKMYSCAMCGNKFQWFDDSCVPDYCPKCGAYKKLIAAKNQSLQQTKREAEALLPEYLDKLEAFVEIYNKMQPLKRKLQYAVSNGRLAAEDMPNIPNFTRQ